MIGLSRKTGQLLSGWDYFTELAEDALTTQLGSREKRRDYGSRLPELLSRITGDDVLMLAKVYAAQTFVHPPNNLAHFFKADRILAGRHDTGLWLKISGIWQGKPVQFEVSVYANRP
ncbi:phage baseplate protein [Oceanospirillum sediminis]|uniref:Phage baseplate protein n=1 Tax=Oceanospirillum sediminis TaxID=2760088 RepID=A0A839IXR3_9GAMM|nr:phage baseplate protein [Oceanospirillum sediminis]MBB1489384.1 phage baseplate protein [Oceanospirillum sediminis]